tara:strand:- start:156 stop:1301 length:1146 start_codon:yes stop_codon:yes gene_type:complete
MAFNIGAFLGGAAKGGSQVLDERRAAEEARTVTQEQRQWQIATEGRKASYDKKIRRQDKDDELKLLVEEASMYYNTTQMAELSTLGKSKLSYAIEQAKLLKPQGIATEDLYKLSSINNPDDVDRATTSTSTYFDQFAKVKPDEPKFEGNLEGYGVFAAEELRLANTKEDKDYWTTKIIEISNMAKKDPDGTYKPSAISVATKGVNDTIDAYFALKNKVTVDPVSGYVKRMAGDGPDTYHLTGEALGSLMSNPAYKDDSVMKEIVSKQLAALDAQVVSYKDDAMSNYNKYVNEVEILNALPTGGSEAKRKIKVQTDKVAGLSNATKLFIPLDPNNPITMEAINEGAHRNYALNTVIQVQDKSGQYGFVIVTSTGVLKLSGNN